MWSEATGLPATFETKHARAYVWHPYGYSELTGIGAVNFTTRTVESLEPTPHLGLVKMRLEGSLDFLDEPGEWAIGNDGFVYWYVCVRCVRCIALCECVSVCVCEVANFYVTLTCRRLLLSPPSTGGQRRARTARRSTPHKPWSPPSWSRACSTSAARVQGRAPFAECASTTSPSPAADG